MEKKMSVVVAVSEGIKLEDGRYVCELGTGVDFVDAFGHKQLTGTASYLANFVAGEVGCKTRAIELSTLQRAASHLASRVDILEAYQVGGAAVKRQLMKEIQGKWLSLNDFQMIHIKVERK